VMESKKVWQALGKISYGATEAEQKSMVYRRSLYITENMQKGDVLTPENFKAIRPGAGLSPKYYDVLLGKKIGQDVKRGSPMSWDILA
jgi:sialic acid synthase SpsE